MIQLRKANDRGHANHGWLDSWHTFSFADYHDPRHMAFSVLRVINEDFVEPGQGFPTHPHRDMEIITWILEGALEHKDSLGTGSVIRPGDAQRMSAGTGIRHSEFNPSKDEATHLLQIWIMPNQQGVTPSYEQKSIAPADLVNRLRLVASPNGAEGSVTIHQDARLFVTRLKNGEVTHTLAPGRRAWVQVARGELTLNGQKLTAGDGAGIENESRLILAADDAEALLFDLP
ncbi:MAG: pirin family protein [Gammaproteobacteria bacterium]|nr:pirin family protein [Gammaproteobacteria bacterium]